MVLAALILSAALLAIVPVAIATGRSPSGQIIVYGASLIATVALVLIALASLFAPPSTVTLPSKASTSKLSQIRKSRGVDGCHWQIRPQFGDILEFFRIPFRTLLQRAPRLLTVAIEAEHHRYHRPRVD